MAKFGAILFRYRNQLFPLMMLVAILGAHPAYPFGSHTLDIVFDLAGTLLVVAGQALRALTIGYEYIIRGGRKRRVYAETLVKRGVFAHCRNPLYLGNILIGLGFTVIVQATALFIIVPFLLIAYGAIVAAEEAYLHDKFGIEYEKYCQQVNRWWPRWRRFSASVEGMRFNWKRLLVKEFNTTFLLGLAVPGVEIWNEYAVSGTSSIVTGPYVIAAAAAWVAVYAAIWMLKKTGRVKG